MLWLTARAAELTPPLQTPDTVVMLGARMTDWLLADALGIHRSRAGRPVSTYRVFVRDLVLGCSIGIYDYEKAAPQRVRINAELVVAEAPDISRDDISGVLNYELIVDGIKAIVAGGHINLVETLAERVIDLCLT